MRLPRGSLKGCSVFLVVCTSLMLYALLYTRQEERSWSTGKPDLFIVPEPQRLFGHSSLEMSDGMFVYHLNLRVYQSEFPYMQHHQCRLQQERLRFCRVAERRTLLLLATKSHPEAFPRRDALRQTWARDAHFSDFVVKHVFLMAQSPNWTLMQQVAEEDAVHKDILLWDFAESHHNLSLKERCFIQWLHNNCKEADFIFKGDDDEYVNPSALVKYLNSTVNVSTAVHGYIHKGSDSERYGKYKITEAMYPSAKYPMFPSGGGYIIPRTFIPALYHASTWIPVFPLDDVYFGFLGLAAGVTYRHDYRFCVKGMCGRTPEALSSHQDNVDVIRVTGNPDIRVPEGMKTEDGLRAAPTLEEEDAGADVRKDERRNREGEQRPPTEKPKTSTVKDTTTNEEVPEGRELHHVPEWT
ncbi:hypothetical protein NDU88_000377 [Pleurodeles waltl]|uniref:Hexosyltransferase n=1 Tax=Pleurodeles waltl TaxID=8319 RepID=A0AAV7KMP7_PLEWA|nr:hypothetical protein NDU88_000377 [Pleurodeles waltl]